MVYAMFVSVLIGIWAQLAQLRLSVLTQMCRDRAAVSMRASLAAGEASHRAASYSSAASAAASKAAQAAQRCARACWTSSDRPCWTLHS